MKNSNQVILKNLGFFSDENNESCANFTISCGEALLMIGESNIKLLKDLVTKRQHFVGNLSFREGFEIHNLLKNTSTKTLPFSFYDAHYFAKFDPYSHVLENILDAAKWSKAKYKFDFLEWSEITTIHKQLFTKKLHSYETRSFEAVEKVALKIDRIRKVVDLRETLKRNELESYLSQARQGIIHLIRHFDYNLRANWQFYEGVSALVKVDNSVVSNAHIKKIEQKLSETKMVQLFSANYLKKQKTLKNLRQEIVTLISKRQNLILKNSAHFDYAITLLKNNIRYFEKLFNKSQNYDYAKMSLLYKKALRRYRYFFSKVKYLNEVEAANLLDFFNQYLSEFRKNNLYSPLGKEIDHAWIKKQISNQFDFRTRSYLTANNQNRKAYRKQLLLKIVEYLKVFFRHESKKADTLKTHEIETLEYSLHNARIDFLWKQSRLTVTGDSKHHHQKSFSEPIEKFGQVFIKSVRSFEKSLRYKAEIVAEENGQNGQNYTHKLRHLRDLIKTFEKIFKLANKTKILFNLSVSTNISSALEDFLNYNYLMRNTALLNINIKELTTSIKLLSQITLFKLNLLAMQFNRPFLLILENMSSIKNLEWINLLSTLKKITTRNEQAIIYHDQLTKVILPYIDTIHISYQNCMVEQAKPKELLTNPLHLLTPFIIRNKEIPLVLKEQIDSDKNYKDLHFINHTHSVLVSPEQLTTWAEYWEADHEPFSTFEKLIASSNNNLWQTVIMEKPTKKLSEDDFKIFNSDTEDTIIVDL